MKANDFVKKFGWDKAKETIKMSAHALVDCGDGSYFHINQLKRLVDSHELVESCGGLQSVGEKLTHGLYESRAVIGRLEQAIADVESCQ